MYLVYSLDLKTLNIKVYDFCNSKNTVNSLLRNCATNFILIEEGERKSEKAFKDDVSDDQITEDGYFLRSSKEKLNEINVFKRKTHMQNGWTGKYATIHVDKVMVFGITETSLNLPIECSGRTTTKPTFDNEAQSVLYNKFITELSMNIQKRKLLIGNE